MKEILNYAKENFVPIIRDESLNVLINTIKQNQPKHILEIGTAIGYSGIMMLNACNAQLTTVELDRTRFLIAEQNFKRFKLTNRINSNNIDALEFLKYAVKKHLKFDFVFLDGPKGQYINYLPLLTNLLNPNGVIFADNLNFHGMVTGEIPVTRGCRAMIKGLKNYIAEITNNEKLETKIYTNIGDGVGVTKLK